MRVDTVGGIAMGERMVSRVVEARQGARRRDISKAIGAQDATLTCASIAASNGM